MTVKTTVEVFFTLTTGDQPVFRIGNAIKGKVGSTTYKIAGPQWIDITNYVSSISTSRGRNRELDRFSAGKLSVELHNETRAFDPLYATSPFYGNIIPRRSIRISTGSIVQFTGIIEDWNFSYSVDGSSKASIVAADAFTLFAQQVVTAGTSTVQTTGARVGAVLDMTTVAWPSTARDLDTGTNNVSADVRDGTQSALDYLNLVQASEQGQLFIAKNGYVKFIDRANIYVVANAPLFSDDGTGIPYTGASVQYGTDLLYNQVSVSSPAAGTATASNLTSQDTFGISGTSFDTLINDFSSVSNMANWWVNLYGEPEYRFDVLEVSLDSLAGINLDKMLNLELGDPIQIIFTPNDVGTAIDRFGQVIGISNNIAPDSHSITLNVASLEAYAFFILDDVDFGILNTNVLGF